MAAGAILLGCALNLHAAEGPPDRRLIVGTKESPPFAMRNEDGTWRGMSIDLWRKIGAELGLSFDVREYDLPGLLAALKDGSIDVAAAALTVTQEREEWADFSHPFYATGLGIAVKARGGGRWLAVLSRLVSREFVAVVGLLALVLFAVGALAWAFERRRNPEQFGGGPLRGLASSFWWSAVTMTTVGYGDKAPKTLAGRLVGIVWMFAGIMLISMFTAAITSAITVTQLTGSVRGPQDLSRVRVASISGTTSAVYLRRRSIRFRSFASAREALEALERGELDAVVYDAPILRHICRMLAARNTRVLATGFERQDYAFGLPAGSALREMVNRELLRTIADPWWEHVTRRYLGP
jgi:ABC-type amino acid transport substrate-binding protein